MTDPRKIRVLVADDQTLFRKGVVSLLAREPDFEVVGEAANGDEVLERARTLRPDFVLMDLAKPGLDGPEALKRLKRELPSARIVILTSSEADRDLIAAVTPDVQGYLLTGSWPHALFGGLRGAMQGETSRSHAMTAQLREAFARRGPEVPRGTADLTPREQEVLECLAYGRSNKEIAAALDIAENTVKNHLKAILEKLQLENRIQAAAFALRAGLGESQRPPSTGQPAKPDDRKRS